MESRGRAGSEMPGKSGSEFFAADDTRHSVGSMVRNHPNFRQVSLPVVSAPRVL